MRPHLNPESISREPVGMDTGQVETWHALDYGWPMPASFYSASGKPGDWHETPEALADLAPVPCAGCRFPLLTGREYCQFCEDHERELAQFTAKSCRECEWEAIRLNRYLTLHHLPGSPTAHLCRIAAWSRWRELGGHESPQTPADLAREWDRERMMYPAPRAA